MGVHQNFTAVGSERCVVKERSLQRKNNSLKATEGCPGTLPASPLEVCKTFQSLTTPGKLFSLLLYPIFRASDCLIVAIAQQPLPLWWGQLHFEGLWLMVGDTLLIHGCPQPRSVAGSCCGHGWGGLEAAEPFQSSSACCGHLALLLIFSAIA